MRREKWQPVRYRTMFQHYPDILMPSQVQETLRIDRRVTYDLLRSDRIHGVHMERLYRVPKAAVTDYLYETEGRTWKNRPPKVTSQDLRRASCITRGGTCETQRDHW